MRHNKRYIIISMLFIFATAISVIPDAFGEFITIFETNSLICEKVYPPSEPNTPFVTGKQGENFNIKLIGPCTLSKKDGDSYKYVATWWVFYYGSYDYSTKKANETIVYQSSTLRKSSIICSANPWARLQQCDTSSKHITYQKYRLNHGSSLNDAVPLSAQPGVLHGNVKNAIADWETWQSNKELLADWAPMSDLGGPPALTIKKPFELQPINVNDDWLNFRMEINPGFEGTLDYLLEVERLEEVSGEIVDSTGKTHMWQPTGAIPNVPCCEIFPILIKSSSLIEGKLGSYRVRVRGKTGGYTQWRHFQVLDKGKFVASEALLRQSEKKTGGFVPKGDEKTMQTKQGESSLGPEGLQAQKMQGGKKIVKGEKQAVPGGAVVVQKKVIKKPLGLELPELEIKVNSKPAQVCPDKNYNVNITIINHSNLKARFNLCSVGSHTYKCDLGQPPVHEINGKATRSLSMSIRPAAAFVDKGKWHGKVFLGKVKSQTNENELLQVGDNQPKEPSDCNVGVSTSWSGGAGFIAGILFCDKNMDNNLVKLEINSSSALCNPKLIKKMDTEKGSEASKKKTVIKPEIEDKGPESNSGKIIKEPGIQLK